MHEKVCRIIVELKQLELLAAEVEESATSPLLSAAAADGDAAQRNLDAAQRHAQVNTLFHAPLIVITLAVGHVQEWFPN